MSSKSYRWGVLSAGKISSDFVRAIRGEKDVVLQAVAARDLTRAQAFADTLGFKKAYGSYAELVKDAEIDAVYIGALHNAHYELVKLCLHAGKHVLCEKSFTLNAAQAIEVTSLAKEKKLFLMEAMWTRYVVQNKPCDAVSCCA
jgi:predicted dehydrogenase